MTNFLGTIHIPLLATFLGMGAFAILTTWLTTKERAEFREDVARAFEMAGWGVDAAAAQTQTARSRLSAQLNGHAPCSVLGRLPDLPGLELALIKLRAQRLGLVVIEGAELQRLLSTAQAFFSKRPVKKMRLERTA